MKMNCTSLLVAAATAAMAPLAAAQCPNPKHDCYTTGGVGCADETCCLAVCAADPFCCESSWDGLCVSGAITICGAPECPFECVGTPEGEPCGEDTNGGCNMVFPAFGSISCGETVCGNTWAAGGTRDTDWYILNVPGPDSVIVTVTISGQADLIGGFINSTDCATATAIDPFVITGLCGSGSVEKCLTPGDHWIFVGVNGFDGVPCDGGLNDYALSVSCGDVCLPPSCGNAGHDCLTIGGPFCDDVECCELMCIIDPFCCTTEWDQLCVNAANVNCYGGSICPESDHDCFTQGIAGCTDIECCEAVCAADPFCCNTSWDGLCVSGAQALCADPCAPLECVGTPEGEPCGEDTNGGCNMVFPAFGSISCGETVCGNTWAVGGTRDTDWYILNVPGPDSVVVTLTITGQAPLIAGFINSTDCATASAIDPFVLTEICGPAATVEKCLTPGDHWIFVGINGFEGFPCDSEGFNDYILSASCGDVCVPPSCGNAGHDCLTIGGPFCDDVECCELMCIIDPFCCDTEWDQLCVNQANVNCYGGSICPPSDHDCFTTGGPGCTDKECCEAVCLADPFCCNTSWDGLCVSGAQSLCGGGPSCPVSDHDCFTIGGPGCTDTECCDIVCGLDPFCCNNSWDQLCVDSALANCGGPVECPVSDHDCFTVGIAGCTDIECCDLICGLDAFCCNNSWDQLCVNQALKLCGGGFECPVSDHDCVTEGGPGCTDAECCETVCTADPFCCNTAWDDLCVEQAQELCLGCTNPGSGDRNNDGCVDGADLAIVLGQWDPNGTNGFGYGPGDANCDGVVDGADLAIVIGQWTGCP